MLQRAYQQRLGEEVRKGRGGQESGGESEDEKGSRKVKVGETGKGNKGRVEAVENDNDGIC